MRYYANINELEEKVKLLNEKIDLINDQISKLTKIKDEIIWEGIAKDTFMQQYNNYIGDLKKILKHLLVLLLFFKSYYTNFDEEYTKTKEKYSSIFNDEYLKMQPRYSVNNEVKE